MEDRANSNTSFRVLKVKSAQLRTKILELVEEGTTRRIIIEKNGRVLLEIPLAVGIGGAAAAILLHAPLTAVAAIAALATDVKLIVESSTDQAEQESTK